METTAPSTEPPITSQQAPDFGEPWKFSRGEPSIESRDGDEVLTGIDYTMDDACAGMVAPAEEIAAMRYAIKDADAALTDLVAHIEECREGDLLSCDSDPHPPSVFSVYGAQAKRALAKLQPFLKTKSP